MAARFGHSARVADTLSFDPERTVELKSCDSCGRGFTLVKSFILDGEDAHAILFAALHDHGEREAWIDVILGSFGSEDYSDHVTFGCRVGPVQGQADPAATAVAAATPYGNSALFGRKLTRDEALAHPQLSDFWQVVDFALISDPDIHFHVYG
jgi:hypothetical protein